MDASSLEKNCCWYSNDVNDGYREFFLRLVRERDPEGDEVGKVLKRKLMDWRSGFVQVFYLDRQIEVFQR